jgi:myo-inositol-hexaphosphate 3-phosphohydrolase
MLTRLPVIAYILLALGLAAAVAVAADRQTDQKLTQPSDSLAVHEPIRPTAADAAPDADAPRVRRHHTAPETQAMTAANRKALVASLLAAWYIAPQSR